MADDDQAAMDRLAKSSGGMVMDLERELVKKGGLLEFMKLAWPIVEPADQLVLGWHHYAICEHVDAVLRQDIRNLLINVPPGFTKSMIVSVLTSAYAWTFRPEYRIIATSHKDALARRDSRKVRSLINSPWYRRLWGEQFEMVKNDESRLENSKSGFRIIGSTQAGITGERGNLLVVDDPLSREQADSDLDRKRASEFFWETLPTRLSNFMKDGKIVIMQRLHQNDTAGEILERAPNDWEKLILPNEYEIGNGAKTSVTWSRTGEPFEDPRRNEGELLHPKRFDQQATDHMKSSKGLGERVYAGQYQQRPAPRAGVLFNPSWLEIVPAAPQTGKACRGWDLAATISNTAAWTAGLKLRKADGIYYIEDVVRLRGTPATVERTILETARSDGRAVAISLPQDPGQAGKAQAQYLVGRLAGFNVKASTESGDKVTRAEPVASQAEVGNVKLVRGDWNKEFLEELTLFPNSTYKDQVDALSRAFDELARAMQAGAVQMQVGWY